MKINILAGLLWLAAAALFGQEFRGAFSGAVTDAQGAAIAKAKIVATEIHTGAKAGAVSADSGSYTIPFLAPGEYEIAAVNEAVTVSAEAPLLESANSSLGQVITADEVEDFPVNGRMPLQLAN